VKGLFILTFSFFSLPGMLVRRITGRDLLHPNEDFVRKPMRITSDAVGFGFVIRGEGPCYVKTVDPCSPSAAAGLKVSVMDAWFL
jgi:hypothetical protein